MFIYQIYQIFIKYLLIFVNASREASVRTVIGVNKNQKNNYFQTFAPNYHSNIV